jgi:membrane-bound lytic murein transglycosylase F
MRILISLVVSLMLAACSPSGEQANIAEKTPPEAVKAKPIEKISPTGNAQVNVTKQKKIITFVTHISPITYYLNGDNKPAGLEYDLATMFGKEYAKDYEVKFLIVNKINEVIPALLRGKADIAAKSFSVTDLRKHLIQSSQPYYNSEPLLVYNSNLNKKPNHLGNIAHKKIIIPAGTTYAQLLKRLKTKYPKLNWQEDPNSNSEFLLDQVASGELAYTIADSQLVSVVQNYYPHLEVAFAIGEPEPLTWKLKRWEDPELVQRINQFFSKIEQDGRLRNLIDRYYGHTDRLNTNDITHFLERIKTTLPKYKRLFQEAGDVTGLDWRLIAAISYRESHWNTFNTSPTNVRGLMMLTEDTADYMGVTDRLDPKQSIPAGAKYILKMKAIFPKKIPEPDRTYFALAAYNIGYAHVQDARALAKRLGLRQDSWADVKKTLPMLTNPEYYKTVKYGYASGGAPVVLVESVRSYQRILERYQPNPEQDIHTLDLTQP